MRLNWILITSLFALAMVSCGAPKTTPMVEVTPTVLVGIPLPTNTSILMEASTPTALPNYDEGQRLVQELLENNAGCKLPCWWGITPGKTTWIEARPILEKVSLFIGGQESGESFSVDLHVLLPYPYGLDAYLSHSYYIKNGVVNYISVFNSDLAPNYNLNNLLTVYGQPSEIWMRTNAKAEMGIQNYTVDLFYQNKGILIEYSTGNPLQEIERKLQNCMIKDMATPFIHLWSPEAENLSFQDAKKFIDTTNLPEPKPLLEAAGMDTKTFYETFKNPATDVCLETPKDLWP